SALLSDRPLDGGEPAPYRTSVYRTCKAWVNNLSRSQGCRLLPAASAAADGAAHQSFRAAMISTSSSATRRRYSLARVSAPASDDSCNWRKASMASSKSEIRLSVSL